MISAVMWNFALRAQTTNFRRDITLITGGNGTGKSTMLLHTRELCRKMAIKHYLFCPIEITVAHKNKEYNLGYSLKNTGWFGVGDKEINSELFIEVVNGFLQNFYLKKIGIDYVFFTKEGNTEIDIDFLSIGEKCLIEMLFLAFYQKEEKCVYLLDLPESFLCTDWQMVLIDTIQAINPNAQIIITTHSTMKTGIESLYLYLQMVKEIRYDKCCNVEFCAKSANYKF